IPVISGIRSPATINQCSVYRLAPLEVKRGDRRQCSGTHSRSKQNFAYPRSIFSIGFRRRSAWASHGPDGVGSHSRFPDLCPHASRGSRSHLRNPLLYARHHALLRARIRFPRRNRRIPFDPARKITLTALPVLSYAWFLAPASRTHGRRFRLGLRSLGTGGSYLDVGLEHGVDGADRTPPRSVDRRIRTWHDHHPQSARSHRPRFVRELLLAVDSPALARPHCTHRAFFVLRPLRSHTLGRSHGYGLRLWNPAASA